jgi:surface protein
MITKEQLRDKILKNEDITSIDYSHITDMSEMFYGCSRLKKVPHLDTSKVTKMSEMFSRCSELKEVPEFDTSKVTNMGYMFNGCSSLEKVPKFNISSVSRMYGIFSACLKLKTVPFADKIKDLGVTCLPFLEELESLPEAVKVKLLMDTSDFKDKKIQAMLKLYKE